MFELHDHSARVLSAWGGFRSAGISGTDNAVTRPPAARTYSASRNLSMIAEEATLCEAASPIYDKRLQRARHEGRRCSMTTNPNTSIHDLRLRQGSPATKQTGSHTAGSLVAAAFIVAVSFIARRFYR
ncbi:hypothetical protein [Gordonibacter sp.]|uniref:hypothetical protein n=1 Tax=Gordonibacter sp. TaxID=1968902 RepID=UPI002FC5843E